MDVHLRDLRYFVAVAEELHFTRAADRLQIAQPTLTRQIRQLERQLNVPLFDRDHRSVRLTPAGKELLAASRELLATWDAARGVIADRGGVLRVGLQTAVGRGLLPDLAGRLPYRLDFRQYPWTDPTAGLASGEADVALLWLPVPGQERLRWRVLRTESRWVLLAAGHPLAAQETIAFAQLHDEPFVALPSEAGVLRDYWLAIEERQGHRARIAAEAATADEKLEAISVGTGVCLIAEGNVALYRRPGVVARPVTGISPCQLAIAWRSGDDRAAVADLVAAAVEGGW